MNTYPWWVYVGAYLVVALPLAIAVGKILKWAARFDQDHPFD